MTLTDDEKLQLEFMLTQASRDNKDLERWQLVRKVLEPKLFNTIGEERANLCIQWLLREVDPANAIDAQDYLDVIAEVARLITIIDRHLLPDELSEDEQMTVSLAMALANLHDLTKEWKKEK